MSAPFDLSSLLIWIATGGGAAAIVSFIAYRWAWFQQQPPDRKALYILLSTAVLAILAKLGIDLIPPATVQALAPYVAILIVIFTSWAASQGAYKLQQVISPASGSSHVPPAPVADASTLGPNAASVHIGGKVQDSKVAAAGRDVKQG